MWLLMFVNGASIYTRGQPLIDEYLMILTVVIVGWSCVFHQVYYTIEDFKRVLNIQMFTIKPMKKSSTWSCI